MPVRAGKLMKRKIYWTFYSLMDLLVSLHDPQSSSKGEARKTLTEQRKLAAERERKALEICQAGKGPKANKSQATADYSTGRDLSLQSLQVETNITKPRAASRSVSFLLPQAPTENLVMVIELNGFCWTLRFHIAL
jgi:type II secretory pathway component PulM